MKKIFLVEDDPEIAQLLALHFTAPNYGLSVSSTGKEAIQQLTTSGYHLVLLDIMLPDMDGIEICKTLRANKVTCPIIMLTSRAEEIDKVVALEMGADDYVTKPFGIRELMARVKAVLRRSEQSPLAAQQPAGQQNEIGIKDLLINKEKRQVSVGTQRLELTAKEFDLLYLLAANGGKTFSRQQLLEAIWGYTFKGYEHTITSHINRLRLKIEPNINDPVYILTTWGIGYRFTE